MQRSLFLLLLLLLAAIAVAHQHSGAAMAQGDTGATTPPAPAAARRRHSSSLSSSSSTEASDRAHRARAKAIGSGKGGASSGERAGRGGADGLDGEQQQEQQGGAAAAAAAANAAPSSSSSSSSSSAALRQQRVRTAAGAGSLSPADYTYIPVDGRVLLRPRSLSKLRDYTLDAYGGVNEIAQAQPFFAGASVSGRVGLAARYNLDYSDYLTPRNIQARLGPSAHVATATTARAQGTGGFKAATDSVATRRASYRLDVADGMTYEAGLVSQRLNAAGAGATIERDQV